MVDNVVLILEVVHCCHHLVVVMESVVLEVVVVELEVMDCVLDYSWVLSASLEALE